MVKDVKGKGFDANVTESGHLGGVTSGGEDADGGVPFVEFQSETVTQGGGRTPCDEDSLLTGSRMGR